jgi:hypothetical protein
VRKLFLAAIAAALAVAGFAVFALAGEGQGNTSLEFTFTKKAENKPTGSNTVLRPAKQDDKGTPEDPSDDHYDAPSRSVVVFPAGSNVDTGAKARCKESPSDVQAGRATCPSRTKIGSGLANSLLGQPDAGGGTEVVAPIEAYNLKNGILFIIRPCQPGTGPGQPNSTCTPIPASTIALVGEWSKVNTRPTLNVPTPEALQGRIIITRFQLKTNRITGPKGQYVTTPDVCPRSDTWLTLAKETYEDGTKQTIRDTQPCNA